MMEAPSMLPFDSRTATSGPLQRPIMAPQYMMPGPYSSAPMTTLSAPHYQPHPHHLGYHSPPTPPHHGTHLRHYYYGRKRLGSESDDGRLSYSRDIRTHHEDMAPSPARSDSRSVATNPSLAAKTIISNETLNPEHQVNFETEVDELMKAIQLKAEKKTTEVVQLPPTPGMSPMSEVDSKSNRKRYVCNGPSCNKSFTQKTHLDIHRRTHTGDKPYNCDFPGCKLTFSQLGNLKTHVRRHTGERPYSCEMCGRRFAQRGNVRAHEQTHLTLKPFICLLDDCNKSFSQLGNMKTHQNNFHKKTLKNLTLRFAQVLNSGSEVPPEDAELFEYFALHYKNSNKGIKGRGKARTVADRKNKQAEVTPRTAPPHPQMPLPQIPRLAQSTSYHPQGALSHPRSLAAYRVSRGHANMVQPIPREYEMFDMDDNSTVPSSNASANGMLYEEEHLREMSFPERLY